MTFEDLIIENFFAFLTGAGVALLPFSLEKGWKLYTRWKYREMRKVYSIIIPELTVGKISFQGAKLPLEMLLQIAPLEEWEQIGRILEELIFTAQVNQRERLEKVLNKETVDKWVAKYQKRENPQQ